MTARWASRTIANAAWALAPALAGGVGGERDQPADAQLALGGVEHAQLPVPPDDLERFTGELRRRHDPPE